MENCDEPINLQDSSRGRRVSARQAEAVKKPGASRCPCCRDDQVLNSTSKRRHSAASAVDPPRKRRRSSVARPSKPSAEHSEVFNVVSSPGPSTSAADTPDLSDLVPRPRSPIPPADLPAVSIVAPGPQPSAAPLQHDGPLKIFNRSVEEYQQLYHEVVDDMLSHKNGRVRPYSVELGLGIKQKLWERLDRPTITESADEDGLVQVDVSYGVGVGPPRFHVDTSGEPKPRKPPKKRVKK